MQIIKKFNESNGPDYGKQETTKSGLKFIPNDTNNPTLLDYEEFDDSIPNDNTIDYEEENIINYEEEKIKRPHEIKKFKQLKENNNILKTKELYEGEYGDKLKNLDELIELYTKKLELLKLHRKGLIQKLQK